MRMDNTRIREFGDGFCGDLLIKICQTTITQELQVVLEIISPIHYPIPCESNWDKNKENNDCFSWSYHPGLGIRSIRIYYILEHFQSGFLALTEFTKFSHHANSIRFGYIVFERFFQSISGARNVVKELGMIVMIVLKTTYEVILCQFYLQYTCSLRTFILANSIFNTSGQWSMKNMNKKNIIVVIIILHLNSLIQITIIRFTTSPLLSMITTILHTK